MDLDKAYKKTTNYDCNLASLKKSIEKNYSKAHIKPRSNFYKNLRLISKKYYAKELASLNIKSRDIPIYIENTSNDSKGIRSISFDKNGCVLKVPKSEQNKKPLYLLPAIIKFRESIANIVKDKKYADTPIKQGIITVTPASVALANCCVLICNQDFLSCDIIVLDVAFIRVIFLPYFTSRYVCFIESNDRVFPYRENLYRKKPVFKIILMRVKKFSHGLS